jgi:hypothetical protein
MGSHGRFQGCTVWFTGEFLSVRLKINVPTILLIMILQGYLAPEKLHCPLLWKTI